jgi:hypothetical protein
LPFFVETPRSAWMEQKGVLERALYRLVGDVALA